MEKQTLGEIVARKLMEMIREKGYESGDKLPTEAELSRQLEVGRNTIREALRILMSRNLVVIRQGSGTFISEKMGISEDPLGFSMVEDRHRLNKDLIQVRILLEPSLAALAAQNAAKEEIDILEQILLEMEYLLKKKQDYWEKDIRFHEQIARCTHNMVMSNLIPVIARGVRVFANTVQETEYEQTFISHRKIFEAIKNRQPVEAQQAMYFHLMYNANRYLEERK